MSLADRDDSRGPPRTGTGFPFRFQREPEPARAILAIADASDVSAEQVRGIRAGSGDRLVIMGDGDAFAALADQTRDLLIDPARGNWDFFADHPGDYARSSAIEALLPIDGDDPHAAFAWAARYILARAIDRAGETPGATLATVRDLVRGLSAEDVAACAGHDPADAQAQRWGFTVQACAIAPMRAVADHDPRIPKTAIARWLAGPASVVLFVRHGDKRHDREIAAIDGSLRDHAMLARLDVAASTPPQHTSVGPGIIATSFGRGFDGHR